MSKERVFKFDFHLVCSCVVDEKPTMTKYGIKDARDYLTRVFNRQLPNVQVLVFTYYNDTKIGGWIYNVEDINNIDDILLARLNADLIAKGFDSCEESEV